jgi:hypothetical protein
MKTMNYFIEKSRMTKQQKTDRICKLSCIVCPLSIVNNDLGISCSNFEMLYPDKAIAIIQKWSDEHPPKTYLSEFLKHYPNAPLGDGGTPTGICPYELGLMGADDCRNGFDCVKCWNQPIEGGEE